MTRRKRLLGNPADQPRQDRLAAANTTASAVDPSQIVELDPQHVHVGGLNDRFEIDAGQLHALADSILTMGQTVPILVRPHPEQAGNYEIIAGRRRLLACRMMGLPVRAEIRDMSHELLIMAQAAENIAREDLTYIERARLAARMVDEEGLDPTQIDAAFSCGKTDRSRYLKIGRGVPNEILSFVGKAPGVGRPRWEKLVARMDEDETALPRMRAALAAANVSEGRLGDSSARFSYLCDAAFASDAAPPRSGARTQIPREIRLSSHEKPVGTIARTSTAVQLTLRDAPSPGFLDWLERNIEAVVEEALSAHKRETERYEAPDSGD